MQRDLILLAAEIGTAFFRDWRPLDPPAKPAEPDAAAAATVSHDQSQSQGQSLSQGQSPDRSQSQDRSQSPDRSQEHGPSEAQEPAPLPVPEPPTIAELASLDPVPLGALVAVSEGGVPEPAAADDNPGTPEPSPSRRLDPLGLSLADIAGNREPKDHPGHT